MTISDKILATSTRNHKGELVAVHSISTEHYDFAWSLQSDGIVETTVAVAVSNDGEFSA